jgi:putative membrane protein
MDNGKYHINSKNFVIYKFLNSLFMGTSIGCIFTIYMPLEPSIYSIGGIVLALGSILIATQYAKILNSNYFYKISVFVELVILSVIVSFLVFSYSYQIALCVYIGYQITFVFGSYLVRGETLILKKESLLKAVDISKQSGYLIGLLLSYLIYLFIGIQTSDLKNDKLNLNEHQIELIQHEKQDLLIGFKLKLLDEGVYSNTQEVVGDTVNAEINNNQYLISDITQDQKEKLRLVISQNQVYYLHYVLVFIEISVILFLIRSFVRNRN